MRPFNPDETPEEAKERIRTALAGLDALREQADQATEEDRRAWEEVIKAVTTSRNGGDDPGAPGT